MPIKIKIKKKHALSNKSKTLPVLNETKPSGEANATAHPHPFIDRLSVIVNVPETDAASIHSNIWTQLKDQSVFVPAPKGGKQKAVRRIALASLISSEKWPYFEYFYSDGIATKLRLDFVPVDLGHQGLLELHSVLTSIIPNGWSYFIEHGHITRLDVSVDFPDARMDEFHFLPKQGATVKAWGSDGVLQTFQHGKAKGNHTQIYNRKAKRIAQNKAWQSKTGIRVERRLIGPNLRLCEIASLPNAFSSFMLVERYPQKPASEAKEYIWQLFMNAAEHMTLPVALSLLPAAKRTEYRQHLKQQAKLWWDADEIWKHWPTALAETKIATIGAWEC